MSGVFYRHIGLEDYTKVYPIARGSAPIFIVIFSLLFFSINISTIELIGIFTISIGIIILSFQNFKNIKNYSAIFYAMATGFFISCYSITDGFGGRASLSPLNYTAWLMISNALVAFPILLVIMKKTAAFNDIFTNGKKIFLWVDLFLYSLCNCCFGPGHKLQFQLLQP